MEFRWSPGQAREADILRFIQKVPNREKQFLQIQRFFHKRPDARGERGEPLVGASRDDDNRQKGVV